MKYNFKETEESILEFWKKKKIYEKARTLNMRGKNFYFLDGPPYTSGRIHIGTAWNKALKDAFLRYKRMRGFNVWDRAGYDMHGLPTELKVEKKLGIKGKQEIPNFGVAKFVEECKKFALENMRKMNEDFIRMGVWMDFDNAYQPIKNSYMENEWWLVKKAHENNRLYKGKKVMHWCAKCATALAKHELEYKNITDDSIFLKFKIKDKDEYLIIWTTTPWTIPFNLGVMVNPDFDYVKVKVDEEIWILAKALVGAFFALIDKQYKIIEEFKGTKLKGVEYIHPLADEIDYSKLKEKHPKVHTVVLSTEYVDLSAGTGLVHMATGCGPEDQEVGKKNNIPTFNTLDEYGEFKELGKFTGYIAKKDDKRLIEIFKDKLCLIKTTKVDHEYAHCWRCKNPVIYRTTDQWFFKIEDLRERMIKLNKKVLWVPKFGSKRFDEWIENLKDNGITRQRYWGTPVPIWQCKCGKYEVIGSIKELEKKADVPADIHKPYIDEVEFDCSCGKKMKRIPDILDVWIDAATASWNCLDYPREKHYFRLFPADFILEATEQVRLWFSMMMICSVIAIDKLPFLNVYMHGMILDFKGMKMSKSLGNIIGPDEVFEKYGVDAFRLYTIANNTGIDLNYNDEDLKVKLRNLMVLWNLANYLLDLKSELKIRKIDIEEKYILSKLNSTIKKCTEYADKYELDSVPGLVEELFLELSRTYIQLTRNKDKSVVSSTIYEVLINVLKLLAPICPFITEKIYQNIKDKFRLNEQSIHHFRWPKYDEKKINEKLEENMFTARQVIQSILFAREKAKIGVRWPLKEAIVNVKDKKSIEAVNELKELIKVQTNIKDINFNEIKFKTDVKIDYNKLGPDFGKDSPSVIAHLAGHSTEAIIEHIKKEGKYSFLHNGKKFDIVEKHLILKKDIPFNLVDVEFKDGFIYLNKEMNEKLEAEGYARELMRRIQALRKKAGLNKEDKITLFIQTDKDALMMLTKWNKKIAEKVGADKIKISEISPARIYKNKKKESIRGTDFEVMFNKV